MGRAASSSLKALPLSTRAPVPDPPSLLAAWNLPSDLVESHGYARVKATANGTYAVVFRGTLFTAGDGGGQHYALKLFKRVRNGPSEGWKKREIEHCRLLSELGREQRKQEHGWVPEVIQVITDHKAQFIGGFVTPYFQSIDVRRTTLTCTEMGSITSQLLQSLSFIHSHGIAHLDLKWENILVTPSSSIPASSSPTSTQSKYELRLCDFGLSVSLGQDKGVCRPTKSPFKRLGTASYRPPESLFCWPLVHSSMDMWAAGCTIAELWFRFEPGTALFHASNEAEELKMQCFKFGTDDLEALMEDLEERGKEAAVNYSVPDELYDLLNSTLHHRIPKHKTLRPAHRSFSDFVTTCRMRGMGRAPTFLEGCEPNLDYSKGASKTNLCFPFVHEGIEELLEGLMRIWPDERMNAKDTLKLKLKLEHGLDGATFVST
ncbi:kinase-like protein [Atractiella rhizophila]|nr:kinase-like protein [Atractiella rhizophila]